MDDNKTSKTKSVWNDISKGWGRIAGVITAVGVSATFITKIFNTSPELTYSLFGGLGVILLIISFYVDKQTEYTHEEIIKSEKRTKDDFSKSIQDLSDLMYHGKDETYKLKEDSDKKIAIINDNISKILEISEDTRIDTVRIQLMMIMTHDPDNVDTILKLAQKYFVELNGDWYMTSEFYKWAKKHDVTVPTNIYNAIDNNHKIKE